MRNQKIYNFQRFSTIFNDFIDDYFDRIVFRSSVDSSSSSGSVHTVKGLTSGNPGKGLTSGNPGKGLNPGNGGETFGNRSKSAASTAFQTTTSTTTTSWEAE